jgi:hypothetical protein
MNEPNEIEIEAAILRLERQHTKYALVSNDEGDWIGLYEDGKLLYEGHSIDESKMLDLLGIKYRHIGEIDCNEFGCRMPATFAELEGRGQEWTR